jgi:hypothetical protein
MGYTLDEVRSAGSPRADPAGTGERSADVLYVSYRRPEYTRLSLERLLADADDSVRVWLWHNGTDEETLEVVRAASDHPRVHEFNHSVENQRLRGPTNWLWQNATGAFLGKVDDDCLVPTGWTKTLGRALVDAP